MFRHGGAATKYAVLVAGLALALAGCTGDADDEKPAPPTPSVSEQKEPEPAPVEQERQTNNCGLNPADMDEATKAQCGLVPEAPAADEAVPECTGNTSLVPESPIGPYCDYSGAPEEMSFEEQCQASILTAEDGCPSAYTPEDDGPGSRYTNPESPMYQGGADCTWGNGTTVYCEGPNGSYSFEDNGG